MSRAIFTVGIDLGTTNSAIAFAPLTGSGPIRVLEIAQLIAPGAVGRRSTLPSFLYLPGPHDLPAGALALPWDPDRHFAIGELARAQGALVPGRLVASAKSWLCHPGVDRTAPILPWGTKDVAKLSPVDASCHFLAHLREAWDATVAPEQGGARLVDQEIVLTVPASFDEVARELTLEAATRAGLPHVTLLEEPQAAFYSFLATHGATLPVGLDATATVLVCDIGGGTTDFTLIARRDDGRGAPELERLAVGDHLLLGGDNMDLALARTVEGRLTARGATLDSLQWQGLVQTARAAKETLLAGERSPERVPVQIGGRGSRLIGAALQDELSRKDALDVILDGFLPAVEADAEPARGRRVGLAEWGLPYAADPAVTRHLAAFLRRHAPPGLAMAQPTAVLFNGGVLKAKAIAERIVEVLGRWAAGARPTVLENDAPDLAVARGAAYYGLVRHGHGVRIRAGAARAFYLELGDGRPLSPTVESEGIRALCVAPRGMAEGSEHAIGSVLSDAGGDAESGMGLGLLIGRPVRFRVFSSNSRRGDRPGELVTLAAGEVETLPQVYTVLRSTRPAPAQTVAIRLRSRTTEIGTLELFCEAPALDERWRLQFDLRAESESGGQAAAVEETSTPSVSSSATIARAQALVRELFQAPSSTAPSVTPASVMKELEAIAGIARNEIPTDVLRALWDPLRDVRGDRGRSPDHEARWLHLAGFFLRPGFGHPLDDWRIKDLWRVFGAPVVHEKSTPVRVQWWILWRRVAGGLRRTQQDELGKRLVPHLVPGSAKGFRKPPPPEELAEMWRTAGALEQLPIATKQRLGDALLARIEKGKPGPFAYWTIGRLGARVPLCGRADNVVTSTVAERWLDRLLASGERTSADEITFALAQIARRAGDRARDVGEPCRQRVLARLRELSAEPHLVRLVEEAVELETSEQRFAYGDALPPGLVLIPP